MKLKLTNILNEAKERVEENEDLKKQNAEIVGRTIDNNEELKDFIQNEIPDMYERDVGIDMIEKFVGIESKQEHIPGSEKKGVDRDDPDELKKRLINYFIKRMSHNIPSDREMKEEDVEMFVKAYAEKFLNEYLAPLVKVYKEQ